MVDLCILPTNNCSVHAVLLRSCNSDVYHLSRPFHSGRLRVNMGNIYAEQRKYPQAIKMYRMALDQIPDHHKAVRLKILQNIGAVFVKMGQYADAITSFEHIMEQQPDFKTGMSGCTCIGTVEITLYICSSNSAVYY